MPCKWSRVSASAVVVCEASGPPIDLGRQFVGAAVDLGQARERKRERRRPVRKIKACPPRAFYPRDLLASVSGSHSPRDGEKGPQAGTMNLVGKRWLGQLINRSVDQRGQVTDFEKRKHSEIANRHLSRVTGPINPDDMWWKRIRSPSRQRT